MVWPGHVKRDIVFEAFITKYTTLRTQIAGLIYLSSIS
jgi:hypothetical protein